MHGSVLVIIISASILYNSGNPIAEKNNYFRSTRRQDDYEALESATLKEAACLQHLSTQITKKCLIILSFHGVPHACCWHASAMKEEWHESGLGWLPQVVHKLNYYLMETSFSIPPNTSDEV